MSSSVKPHQRAFALTIALIFLVTTVATSVLVVMAIIDENKQKKSTTDQTAQTEKTNQEDAATPKEGALKGTKLANFTTVDKVDSLQVTDLTVGTGEEVKAGATITAHYTGAYAVNGEIFESSKDSGQPATFPLSGVIQGWQQGVPGMKVGGVRRLVIPGALAYGEAPAGYTPGSTERPMGTLVFDIELTAIQ